MRASLSFFRPYARAVVDWLLAHFWVVLWADFCVYIWIEQATRKRSGLSAAALLIGFEVGIIYY